MVWDWSALIAGLGGGLIGGGLTVVAGWITLRGAREQVAAGQRQLDDYPYSDAAK